MFSNTLTESDANNILIGVRKGYDGKKIPSDNKNHPGWLLISFQVGEKQIKLFGVRFKNYAIVNKVKLKQYDEFFEFVKDEGIRPNVIIGDFNVGSALTGKGLSWSKVKTDLKGLKYLYYDATSLESTFSYQRDRDKRKDFIGTTPDNVFVNTKSNLKVEKAFYQWDDKNYADHAMLIVDLELN